MSKDSTRREFEWWTDSRAGEMCVLHRIVVKADGVGVGRYVVVGCDSRCPRGR